MSQVAENRFSEAVEEFGEFRWSDEGPIEFAADQPILSMMWPDVASLQFWKEKSSRFYIVDAIAPASWNGSQLEAIL